MASERNWRTTKPGWCKFKGANERRAVDWMRRRRVWIIHALGVTVMTDHADLGVATAPVDNIDDVDEASAACLSVNIERSVLLPCTAVVSH